MRCHFKGRPAPKVFWTKDGKNMTNFNDGVVTKTYRILPHNQDNEVYEIEAILQFTGIRPSDEGNYRCYGYNGGGRANTAVKYTVYCMFHFLFNLYRSELVILINFCH